MRGVDDLDRQILAVLRTDPRAPWSLVGAALDIDPVTVARRWQHLYATGLAWVTASPGPTDAGPGLPMAAATVEIDCFPGAADKIAHELSEQPHTFTLHRTAGGRDLVALVAAPGLPSLSRVLSEEVEVLRRVRAIRTSVVTATIRDDTSAAGGTQPTGEEEAHVTRPVDQQILSALAFDGRMRSKDLAHFADTSPATIQRRLPALLASRSILLHTELAQPLTGQPLTALFFVAVGARQLVSATRRISGLPGVSTCYNVAGPSNLIIEVWLSDPTQARDFEVLLDSQGLPLQIRDRSLVLRTHKRSSRILEQDGRFGRIIPLNYRPTGPG